MGSFRSSRQGSAALSHVHMRGSRLGIALAAALLLTLLAATPAFGAGVSVDAGAVLRYDPPASEDNNLTITQGAANDFTVSDSAPLTAGAGCTPVDANSATCTGATTIRVNVSFGNDTVLINASAPSTIFGRDGNDNLTGGGGPDRVEGFTGHDTINVRDGGADRVVCAGGDADDVTSDAADDVDAPCRNDNGVVPTASITGGPSNPTADPRPSFSFTANEGDVAFVCTLEPAGTSSPSEFPCSTPHQATQDLSDGDYVFTVRADDDVMQGPTASQSFTVDRTSPEVIVTRLPPFDTSTAHFQLDAIDASAVTFECAVEKASGGGTPSPQPCSSIFTTDPLADGDYVLFVTGTDAVGHSTTSDVPFKVEAVPGGGGIGPPTPPSAKPSRIVIDSLVLIAANPVRMSRRGLVRIRLTCAGAIKCKGRMQITTAQPVRRKSRKLVTLGSKHFSIGANKKRTIKVRFSKSKRRLARRLKRFKAKVVIHEIDRRGNPRISSRVFILRAR